MTHAEMETELAAIAAAAGHYAWIARDTGPRQVPGWVDAVIVGRACVMFAELKTDAGRRTRPQIDVANRLVAAGQRYRLYRPEDFRNGNVRKELAEL